MPAVCARIGARSVRQRLHAVYRAHGRGGNWQRPQAVDGQGTARNRAHPGGVFRPRSAGRAADRQQHRPAHRARRHLRQGAPGARNARGSAQAEPGRPHPSAARAPSADRSGNRRAQRPVAGRGIQGAHHHRPQHGRQNRHAQDRGPAGADDAGGLADPRAIWQRNAGVPRT